MSTRGFITFVIDGTEKTTYNHSDSYPDGLGVQVLKALKSEWVTPDAVRALRVVTEDTPPTPADIERLSRYGWSAARHGGGADLRPGQQWYDLLHETQGDIPAILKAGVIEDASGFPADSLFAEWGYVIDLDSLRFEVYRGFQRSPHTAGRFAGLEPEQHGGGIGPYYPVALVASWPLFELPDETAFLKALEKDDEDDPDD